ncbi:hypothetical protein AGMMS49992_05250 [Clostridia bacterium]|nr:hypothetical protein AGMMS49992_05250 [Clostridia bacterium]
MEDLIQAIREGLPMAWAGWVSDGAPELLPCVLLLELGRSTAVIGDNTTLLMRQIVEARVYAAERERCSAMGDLVVVLARKYGFTCTEIRAQADGKLRGVALTLERWLPMKVGEV